MQNNLIWAQLKERYGTNWKSLIAFELLYKLIVSMLLSPILVMLFSLSLKLCGISYLGNDTIKAYLTNPLVYVIIGAMLLLVTYVTLVEIFGAITGIHSATLKRRLTASQLARVGMDLSWQVIASRNVGIAVFVIFLLPFTNLLPLAGIISVIHIPGFIMDFIWANRFLAPLFVLASAGLAWIALRQIFVLHAFALRRESAKDAFATSTWLTSGRAFRLLLMLLLYGAGFGLGLMLLETILSGIAMIAIHFAFPADLRHGMALMAINGIVIAVSVLTTLISSLLGFLLVGKFYYDCCEADGIDPARTEVSYPSLNPKVGKSAAAVILILTAAAAAGTIADPGYLDTLEHMHVVVAAHRGVSAGAPENSIPAFQAAMDVHSEWIELDVHQTKDQVVVVTHDADINRIAGVDKYVYDLTLDELRSYDVGSWFSPEYKDLRVATLDDVLKLCEGKIKIQIELKPTGNEPDFEAHVAQIVRDNGFTDDCVLASMNADCLKRIKEIAPDMETLYIMAAAIGDLTTADFADGFSIEESNITSQLVQDIHDMGKICYVWTINSDDNIPYLLDAGIDGILTDDPVMIQKSLLRGGMNEVIVKIVDFIYGQDSYFGLFD